MKRTTVESVTRRYCDICNADITHANCYSVEDESWEVCSGGYTMYHKKSPTFISCLDLYELYLHAPNVMENIKNKVKIQDIEDETNLTVNKCANMVDHILREGGGSYGDAIRTRHGTPKLK